MSMNNPEARRAYKKAYREANREKIKAYLAANREKIKAREKAYLAANREKIKEYHRAYLKANREKVKAYLAANREKINAQARLRYPKLRESQRSYQLQRRFGMAMFNYNGLAEAQGWTCKICRSIVEDKTSAYPGKAKTLAVDHDHKTGAVRGLLCGECNTGLGKFKDSPAHLRAAARYIEHHEAVLSVCDWMQAHGRSN